MNSNPQKTDVPVPSSTQKDRRCLSCGSDFLSEGPYNRICPLCKNGRSSPKIEHVISLPGRATTKVLTDRDY